LFLVIKRLFFRRQESDLNEEVYEKSFSKEGDSEFINCTYYFEDYLYWAQLRKTH